MRAYREEAGRAVALQALQEGFAAALLATDPAPPCGLGAASEAQRVKRFAVYRNNVNASLAAALAARFPVVERIVGAEFFRAMALVFIERHPPRSPVLAEYGGDFADFVAVFPPAAELPYLADTARLEWARNRAYHAADANALALDELSMIDPAHLADVRLVAHPALAVMRSPYPVVTIWRVNTHDEDVGRIVLANADGEAALVTRPDLDVLVTEVAPPTAALAEALAEGEPLGRAVSRANAAGTLDLAQSLALLFAAGAIAGIELPHALA